MTNTNVNALVANDSAFHFSCYPICLVYLLRFIYVSAFLSYNIEKEKMYNKNWCWLLGVAYCFFIFQIECVCGSHKYQLSYTYLNLYSSGLGWLKTAIYIPRFSMFPHTHRYSLTLCPHYTQLPPLPISLSLYIS